MYILKVLWLYNLFSLYVFCLYTFNKHYYMYVNPIVLIYPSSHDSFWLTISLFYKSVSDFFCGNMFIGSNLRITCINDLVRYLSYPFDLLNLIWLFLGSTVVLKTALFIFFAKLLYHLVRIPLLFVHSSVYGPFFCLCVLAISILLQCTFACLCLSNSGGHS